MVSTTRNLQITRSQIQGTEIRVSKSNHSIETVRLTIIAADVVTLNIDMIPNEAQALAKALYKEAGYRID